MKKSAKLKRKTIRMIVKNLIVFTVLIAVTAVGVMSWFSQGNSTSTASAVTVACEIPAGLEVAVVAPNGAMPAMDSTQWKDSSFVLDEENYSFLATLSMSPVSSDGISFVSPPLMQTSSIAHVNDGSNPNAPADWSTTKTRTNPNDEYLSFDLYFRTNVSGQNAILDQQTYCGPESPAATLEGTYGNSTVGWSPNSVIGAARMSVVDTSNQRKLLWIPAPFLYFDGSDLHYDQNTVNEDCGLYYKNEHGVTVYKHHDSSYEHGYYITQAGGHQKIAYDSTGNSPNTKTTANVNKTDYKLHKNIVLDEMVQYSTTEYYVNHVRVNMWIEGEDPESRAMQVGGKFLAVLSLRMASK